MTTSEPCVVVNNQGLIAKINEAMARRLGATSTWLQGRDLFSLFPKEVAERRRELFTEVLHNGTHLRIEDETSSGAVFTADITPVHDDLNKATMAVICIRDVTEPKRLEEQRYRLAIAIEQAIEAILILDNDFNIQYVNQSFEAMTGYAQNEVLGKNMHFLYTGKTRDELLQHVSNTLEYADSWVGRTVNTRKDGIPFTCEQTISRIRYKRSKELGYVSVWRDVTHEAALERQLRQAQKMEAIGTLAGGLAHDFNNILGPIILHAELGMQGLDQNTLLYDSLEEILDAANRARGLVDQILSLSRQREHDKPFPFPLSSIVKECLKLLRPSLPPDIRINFVNQAGSDMLLADTTQIHQLIMNLCTNAAHAMAVSGGLLEIALSHEEIEDNCCEYQALKPGRYLRMEVRDTGQGIPKEHLDKIFDPFFTTKKEGKGTGLGLAVVHNIVMGLGGIVNVQSEWGKGSVFSVMLPECPSTHRFAGPSGNHAAQPAGKKLRILLVDDDALTGPGSKHALEEMGHKVVLSRSAYEALALFRQNPDELDLVITEYNLAELGVTKLTKELHLSRPELPVVLCTTYCAATMLERAVACGALAVLSKPFHLPELRDCLQQISLETATD